LGIRGWEKGEIRKDGKELVKHGNIGSFLKGLGRVGKNWKELEKVGKYWKEWG